MPSPSSAPGRTASDRLRGRWRVRHVDGRVPHRGRYGLPIKVVVNNNNSYGQILWEQIVLGYPEYEVRHGQPEADFAAWATACGGYGAKVSKPDELPDAIRALLDHPGTGTGRLRCQPRRASDAAQGQLRAGQGLHPGLPARPTAQGVDARRHRPRQDQPAAAA